MNGEYVVEDIRREFIDTKWAKLYSNDQIIKNNKKALLRKRLIFQA